MPNHLILPKIVAISLWAWTSIGAQADEDSNTLWQDRTADFLPVTAEWTNRAEIADINSDGLPDILFANGGNYSSPGTAEYARIFVNMGPEQAMKEVTEEIFGSQKFLSRVIKVRDINRDGNADILVGTTYQTQSHLLLGLGNGLFKNVTSTHLPQKNASIGDIEFGDVDGDGDLDIALSDWGPGNNMNNAGGLTMLWINDGFGKFTDMTAERMPNIPIQFSWDLEFIDYDNDFDLDLAISCKRCATSRLFQNDGRGYYEDIRALPAYTNNYDFEVMDIDSDGYLDMVTINDGEIVDGVSYSRREHIFKNDGGKRFKDITIASWPDKHNIGEDDNNISFLDFDSDGDPDFLISSLTGYDRLLINDGHGSFSLKQPVMDGSPTPLTLSLIVGDINSDCKIDIVMGQGEGEDGIEERVFIGSGVKPDTAPPIISHSEILHSEKGMRIVARIHDNKSPNMPEDWRSILLYPDASADPLPMHWYGENLFQVNFPTNIELVKPKICAVDRCGNQSCVPLSD